MRGQDCTPRWILLAVLMFGKVDVYNGSVIAVYCLFLDFPICTVG